METIGERAAKDIKKMCHGRNISVKIEMERLNIPIENFYRWAKGKSEPSAYYLRRMALYGYDVIYILTGKEMQ